MQHAQATPEYRIHPAIGFARVGDSRSPDGWYLEPEAVGALPREIGPDGQERPVTAFKLDGQVKRQAARFRIWRHVPGKPAQEMTLGAGLKSVTWHVHVANKKAAWYNFQELVGNVMVDTLMRNAERAAQVDLGAITGLPDGADYALLTLHRPSNVDDPDVFAGLLGALAEVARQMPVMYPVHPRVRARFDAGLPLPEGIRLLEPVGYLASIALQRGARLVLTDSGGIQEETTVLGVPCLTLRENTERPLTVTEGTNRVVGTDPAVILDAVANELANRTPARRPELWDGRAAERIVQAVISHSR
jgi:hypothetical protein